MRFLFAILLLFAITPGAVELVENAAQLIAGSELASHDGEAAECEESCTPLAHHCGCHVSMSAQPSQDLAAAGVSLDSTVLLNRPLTSAHNRAFDPPPIRPPIA